MDQQQAMFVLLSGLSILLLLIPLVLFFINRQRKQRQREQFALAALQRGWQFDADPPGDITHQFHGTTQGIPWHLELSYGRTSSSGSRSSVAQSSTRWLTDVARLPDNVVLFGPRMPKLPASLDFGGLLPQLLLKMAFGDDATRFASIQEVDTGHDTLQHHYTVLSDNAAIARQLAEAQESLLVDWALQHQQHKDTVPVILFWYQGLHIKFSGSITDMPTLDRLVQFGSGLASEAVDVHMGQKDKKDSVYGTL